MFIFLRRLVPQSLRGQFALALSALALLILAAGATAVYTLRTSNSATRELAEERLIRMRDAQDMLQHTLLIERETYRLLTTVSFDTLHSSYADIVKQLEALDHLVGRLAAANDDVAVLDLHQSSQLFRNTTNIVAQLRESALQTEVTFAQTLQHRTTQLQATPTQDSLALAILLHGLPTADNSDKVRQLHARFARQANAARNLPEALRADLAALRSRKPDAIDPDASDLFSMRLQLINEHDVLQRFHAELQTQAGELVTAARAQSDLFTRDYRDSVQRLVETSNRNQHWLLAMLAGSLLLAWLVARVFLGRHVLARLHEISRHLRQGHIDNMQWVEPAHGQDEIGEMARAVEQFLKDRHQLETRTAELSIVKEQLAAQNMQLRQEAVVRLQAEQDLRGLMTEQQTILENIGVGVAFLKERRIVRCNQSFAAMFGYRPDELTGLSTSQLHISGEAYQEIGELVYAAVEIEKTHTSDLQLKRRDGTVFWVERTLTAVDRTDLAKGAIWVVHDIDQRKRAETLRNEQGRVLEMIATSMPLEEVLESIARLVESQVDGMMASILLLEEDGLHLRHGAAPNLPKDYIKAIDGVGIGPQVGSCGTAMYRREQVIVSDIQQDPLWDDFRELATRYGFRACWSTPILSHERKAVGTFALYSGEVRVPTVAETQLIDIATRIAGIAIERKHTEDRIRYMAHHDALTGLPNRTLLVDRLEQAMFYAQRYGRQVTVAFIDLDNFKLINDSLGHNVGDELLKVVAERMVNCVRRTDTVVRLGGDEFVIILFDQPDNTEAVTPTLKKIRDAIAQPVHAGGQDLRVTCSMGLAMYPANGTDTDTLLMNADAAMYRAKELGRNGYQFYTNDMNLKIQEKLALQDGLRNAIARSEFRLLYQPQVDLNSRQIVGVEALIRWQHPKLGMISPIDFIPLAEETGLIVQIGDWVIYTACRQSKAWQDAGMQPITMSVNISARQFRERNLVSRVAQALQETGLEAKYLELELTESLIMQDVDQAIVKMNELQAMGVQLSIDDFGTGYSSLSALKNFPIMRLKIDKSFVRDIPNDEDGNAVATAVISLGHKLNLKVIAEGVETEEQQTFLRDNDCDEMQGYHFSRPVPAADIERLFSPA